MSEQTSRRHRILVLDDEDDVREMAFDMLSDEYDVVLAKTSEEALALIEKEEFSLALIDYHIKGGGEPGSAVVDALVDKLPRDRLFLVTADRKTAGAGSMIRYIFKPYDIKIFRSIIREALAKD